jgi:regulator of protease activity HflC (stomatin/prohibitin superfamily)
VNTLEPLMTFGLVVAIAIAVFVLFVVLKSVAEQYVEQFGNIARAANTIVLPATLSDVGSMVALATKVLQRTAQPGVPAAAGAAPRPGPNVVHPTSPLHAPQPPQR